MSADNTTLFFVRHGQTEANRTKLIQGQSDRSALPGIKDLGLNETGIKQAQALIPLLMERGINPDIVFSSSLNRAKQTGQIIADAFGIKIVTHDGLREMFFGEKLEGVPVEEFKKRIFTPPLKFTDPANGAEFEVKDGKTLRDFHKSTEAQYNNICHPGGETKAQVAKRAIAAINSFVAANPQYKNILIPTHNGLLRFMLPELGEVDHLECIKVKYSPTAPHFTVVDRIKI